MFGILFKLFPTIWWLLKITVLKDKKKAKEAAEAAATVIVKKGNGLFPFVIGAATAAGAFVAAPYIKAMIQVYREGLESDEKSDREPQAAASSHHDFNN